MSSSLRPLALTALLVGLHVLAGHFFPLLYLSVGAVSLPALLCYANRVSLSTPSAGGPVTVLAALLLADHLFRLYSGGTHDQVGKTLCDLALATSGAIVLGWIFYRRARSRKAAGYRG